MDKKCNAGCAGASGEYLTESGIDSGMELKTERPKLLLHSCCGPCSTAVIERLLGDYEITVFYFNPNITDEDEYLMRLEGQKQVIEYFNQKSIAMNRISLMEGEYHPEHFFSAVKGYEKEPEGGARCSICFEMRLLETAKKAVSYGYDMFATTLTVSPHKNYKVISAIGNEIAEKTGSSFLDMDFKKKAGFQRSIELSKEIGLYRQNYCGCQFSKWFLE